MRKLILFALFLICVIPLGAQTNINSYGTNTEKNQNNNQQADQTATLKSSTRLFSDKNDLTSVILIIPSGSSVTVIESDSTYLYVVFEDNEGYILRSHAVIDKTPVSDVQNNQQPVQQTNQYQQQQQQPVQQTQQYRESQPQQVSRFSYLENKYGSNMAARLSAGKIWKGMNSEMVKDSWGTPENISRVISGNIIKEEWIFGNTWLYFENNTLLEWGPNKK